MPPGRTTRASSASVAPGIGDVAQEVRERQVVERAVGEGQRLGGRLDELDAIAEARPRARASISGLWSTPVTRKSRRTSSAATSPVPVATSSTWPPSRGRRETRNRRHRGSWPEREQRADPVVRRAERREELDARSRAWRLLWATWGSGRNWSASQSSSARKSAREPRSPASSRPRPVRARASTSARSTRRTDRGAGSRSTRRRPRSPTARPFAPPPRSRRCARSPPTARAAATWTR